MISNPGYARLLEHLPEVLEAWFALDDEPRSLIAHHLGRTIDGMIEYLERDQGPANVDEVRAYCYYVAGIVGELLTELFIRHSPSLAQARLSLMELAPRFGETLQLVNILRDESDDAREGRKYVPGPDERPQLEAVAMDALEHATTYVGLLERHNAAPGIVAFNTLNLLLAYATLAVVIERGPGAKISRKDVQSLHEEVRRLTRQGESVEPLFERARAELAAVASH